MNKAEFKEFAEVLTGVADYYGKTLKPASIRIYWAALSGIELDVVKRLFAEHVQVSRFMPTIAELLEVVRLADGRPNAEEAWSMVARSLNDEGLTIVWTEEMAAAFGVALGLQDDRVAARMAFKEAYEQAVTAARRQGKPAKWSASLGHDPMGREGPIVEAVKLGRIGADHAVMLLPNKGDISPEVLKLMGGGAIKQIRAA